MLSIPPRVTVPPETNFSVSKKSASTKQENSMRIKKAAVKPPFPSIRIGGADLGKIAGRPAVLQKCA